MRYFDNFPLVEYWFSSPEKAFVAVDFFTRIKFLDGLEDAEGLFEYFLLNDGDRPDIVAFKLYGNSNLHWLVMMVNGVMDPKDWLMGQYELNRFIEEKYDNPDSVKYLERDGVPASLLGAQIRHLKNPFNTVDSFPVNSPATEMDPTKFWGVTFREFEDRRNDNARMIRVIRPEFVNRFLLQMEDKLRSL